MSDEAHTERLEVALAGKYRIERKLGEGGMATVYLAEDLKHERKVALKVLRPELAAVLGAERFLSEIKTTANLQHPHILPLFDSGNAGGYLYYVMPFIDGDTLREKLDREKQLGVEEAVKIASDVASALDCAHGRGVVHRDVKPANILLHDGHTVLADFGIAHAVSESGGDGLTRTGAVLGTPHYMSPEQANAEAVDARSDLYALACVAFEMLVGSPPFTGPTGFVIMARHSLDPVPSIRTARPGVPHSVADTIERALAKTPADRFATVAEWRDTLGRRPSTGETHASSEPDGPEPEEALGVPLSDRPSIAILPFKSLGSDSGEDYISDGIRLGIQATLVQLSGLFLVNASALNLYRGSEASAASVGRELGVHYVLEGAGQHAGPRIRVTVQLTDIEAGQVIWAERYDRLLDDVFELQDEITREVITALNVELLYPELGRVWFAKIKSSQAREYFYRGSSYLYEGTQQDNAAAREMFTELYRVEPDSVMGPSNIAVTHWLEAFLGWSDSPEKSLEQADEWAKKAMEYEDNNGIGHAIHGHLRVLERQYDQALDACSQAVQLRNNCPLAHGLLGLVLNYCGDPRGAVKHVREALSLERVYPPWLLTWLAAAHRDAGEVETSISAVKESLRLDPTEPDALLVLCSDYQLAGRSDEARRIAEEVTVRDPKLRLSTYGESHPYKDEASLDLVTGALRAAGLPD